MEETIFGPKRNKKEQSLVPIPFFFFLKGGIYHSHS
jgi:hypothetical protein